MVKTAEDAMLHDVEQNLKNSTTQQIALLTIWHSSLTNQVQSFIHSDILRLFAKELSLSTDIAHHLLHVLKPETGSEKFEIKTKSPEEEVRLNKFMARIPGLQQMLNDFVEKNSIISGQVLTPDLQPYLFAGEKSKAFDKIIDDVSSVFKTKTNLVLPIRRFNRELVVDIAFPIFAPKYIDPHGEHVVGVFLATYSVQKIVSAVDQTDKDGFFTGAVLEQTDNNLQLIDSYALGCRRELGAEWEVKDETIKFGIRREPTRYEKFIDAYTLAVKVPNLPWYVLQAMRINLAQANYLRFRENVYIGCGLAISLVLIMLIALWWWLVGRRERALAEQMRKLYLIANEQKQILDGVNRVLSAGVVLNDLFGVLYYVNQKYAEMAQIPADKMYGMKYNQLPYPLAKSLVTHTLAISEKPELANFTEILPLGGESRHYLTACSPFTDENNCLVGMVSVYSDITELILAQEKAQRMVKQTVAVFVRAIEAIDPYLCGQSGSMAQLAGILAHELKHDDEETLATLDIAASLSQIGMIQLPSQLLLKTGALTAEEREQMHKHVEYARSVLEGVDFGLPVLETITQMYERLDGSGYPKKLKGDEICFNARILAVANTFCAVMRPRSYRTALSCKDALNLLETDPPKYDLAITKALRDYLATPKGQEFLQSLIAGTVGLESKTSSSTDKTK
ncbi:MAG: PAS domain-containing protein [Desulfovibrionaceae bacterium]|nr:PAS domain-containing protein [Desulfovibrionaceae bacterium]